MKRNNRISAQFQPIFEQLLPVDLDKTKNNAGDYVHKTTQAMWLGFTLFTINRTKDKWKSLLPQNCFVLARNDVNGTPRFAITPRKQNLITAQRELERLATDVPGHVFSMWQLVDTSFVEKTGEQRTTCYYTKNRLYHNFDASGTYKHYFVMDEFGNSVRSRIYHVIYSGEVIELRMTRELKR